MTTVRPETPLLEGTFQALSTELARSLQEDPSAFDAKLTVLQTQALTTRQLSILFRMTAEKILPESIQRLFEGSKHLIGGSIVCVYAQILVDAGNTDAAITMLSAQGEIDPQNLSLLRKRMEVLHTCKREKEVSEIFQIVIQGGEKGFVELLSFVHNLLERSDAEYAAALWEAIKAQTTADPEAIGRAETNLLNKFGRTPFSNPVSRKKEIKNKKEKFAATEAMTFQRFMEELAEGKPDDRTLSVMINHTRNISNEKAGQLWQAILRVDPSKQGAYKRFKKQRHSRPAVPGKEPKKTGFQETMPLKKVEPKMSFLSLEQWQNLPHGNEKNLTSEQQAALLQLALAAGCEGGDTRSKLETLVTSLKKSGGLTSDKCEHIELLYNRSQIESTRSVQNDHERTAVRSNVLSGDRAIPKVVRTVNRQTFAVISNSDFVPDQHPQPQRKPR